MVTHGGELRPYIRGLIDFLGAARNPLRDVVVVAAAYILRLLNGGSPRYVYVRYVSCSGHQIAQGRNLLAQFHNFCLSDDAVGEFIVAHDVAAYVDMVKRVIRCHVRGAVVVAAGLKGQLCVAVGDNHLFQGFITMEHTFAYLLQRSRQGYLRECLAIVKGAVAYLLKTFCKRYGGQRVAFLKRLLR